MTGLIQLRAHGQSGITNFAFGNLNGGGYADELAFAPDGSTIMERGNLANSVQWQRTGDTVVNISTSPYMDGVGIAVAAYGSPYGHAYGKLTNTGGTSHRLYCVCGNMPQTLGYAAFASSWGQLIRSDDNGQTWVKPGPGGTVSAATLTQPISTGGSSQMYFGPKLACDPTNDDILWIMGYSGGIYVTFNAGQSWHIVTGVMDAAGLPNCLASGNYTVPTHQITCQGGNPIFGLGGTWGIFNATNQFCAGSSNGGDGIAGSNATDVAWGGYGFTRTGAYSPVGGEASTNNNDKIYFGLCGGIIIDQSAGTTANPGIALGDTAATGSASNLIYFSWQNGSTSLWKTTSAGGNLTSGQFSVVGSGGPIGNFFKMKLSNDAALVGGQNVLWVPDGVHFWRYVGAAAPTGSGLSTNTWTSYNPTSLFSGQDLTGFCALPDPQNAGHVAFYNIRAQNNRATGYGDTGLSGVNGTVICTGGDTPWLNADNPFLGDIDFDRVTSGLVWYATGCGMYNGNVVPTAGTLSLAGKMSPGLQSLIIVSLVKCPTTGVIIINAQDRNVVFQPNQTTQASKWYYQPSVVPNTGFGCYALDDPTVMFTTVASVARSSDAGATLPDIAFSYNLPFGGVQSLTINAAGSGYTSNGVHTNVSLIGGSGSGATADITITGGVVTAATPNVPGDLYAEYFPSLGVAADVFSFSDASVGGRTGGSAASIAVHEVGMFKTTNTSTTVTVTDKGQGTGFAGHGLTTGDKVGFANVINTNNAIVNNTSLTVTVTDSNHYTIVSSTTANATGVFGGYGGYLNFNGVYRGINGYSGGLSNIVAPTKRDVFCIGGGGFAANYGISTDDVNYFWNAATGPGGTVLRGFGGNAFGKNKPLAIETATGKMAYIEYDFGSPNQDRANSFLVSTDKGHTWTCPGGVGNLTSTWTGFAGGGTGANLSSVTGHNTHWFAGGGFPGDNSINITTLYLRRTRDDGSTWDEFTTNTGFAMFVCAGPNAVGASYPSIYMYGLANGNVFPNFALYRCDNMTGVSGDTTACIWKELPNMIKVDCSSITGLTPDYDIPGRIYILTGDEGYMYTTLT